jgi:hypothetical protein
MKAVLSQNHRDQGDFPNNNQIALRQPAPGTGSEVFCDVLPESLLRGAESFTSRGDRDRGWHGARKKCRRGPDLPDGRLLLLVVNDNNLVAKNARYFYAFAVDRADLESL